MLKWFRRTHRQTKGNEVHNEGILNENGFDYELEQKSVLEPEPISEPGPIPASIPELEPIPEPEAIPKGESMLEHEPTLKVAGRKHKTTQGQKVGSISRSFKKKLKIMMENEKNGHVTPSSYRVPESGGNPIDLAGPQVSTDEQEQDKIQEQKKGQNQIFASNQKLLTCHHVVYSVKGGCGKTSFALLLLLSNFIEGKVREKIVANSNEAQGGQTSKYLLDIDFLGTSYIAITEEDRNSKGYLTINNLIFDEVDIEELYNNEDKADSCSYGNCLSEGVYIIPSSSKEKDKERFHVKRKYTPLLKYDEFRYEIEAIIDRLKLHEQDQGLHTNLDIIYDLPPNSDGYTEALFDYLVKRTSVGDKVIVYLVYNNNPMLKCNIDWMDRFTTSSKNDNFTWCIVCNETDESRQKNNNPQGDNEIISVDDVEATVKGVLKSNTRCNNLCYVYSKYSESLRDFSNKPGMSIKELRDGLENESPRVTFSSGEKMKK